MASDAGGLLAAARGGDARAFELLTTPYRGELQAHCYRMLGSAHDAEDAVQEALIGAWRGIANYEGRASVRSWLYRIATNAALRISGKRMLPTEYGPAFAQTRDLGEPVTEPIWLEPYPDAMLPDTDADPAARYEARESVELAFVAALQHLPAKQRAVLILREVLAFSAAEVADQLDTSVASVNSALQRARASLDERVGRVSQQEALAALGDDGQAALMRSFIEAWERADIEAILALLVDDAQLSMPPLPAWFDGIAAIRRFLTERVFETPWRLVPIAANGQLALACYQGQPDGSFTLGVVNVLTLRDQRISAITSFLEPAVQDLFEIPRDYFALDR